MNKDDLLIAKKYFAWLKKKKVSVKGGYVFGSRVKGTDRPGSDLDICVITDSFGKDLHRGRVELLNMGTEVSDLIEPHLMTEEDFADKYNFLAAEIKRTGIKVV